MFTVNSGTMTVAKAKSYILTDLRLSGIARSAWDLWFTFDVRYPNVISEAQVRAYLNQQVARKHGSVAKSGDFYTWK